MHFSSQIMAGAGFGQDVRKIQPPNCLPPVTLPAKQYGPHLPPGREVTSAPQTPAPTMTMPPCPPPSPRAKPAFFEPGYPAPPMIHRIDASPKDGGR